MTNGNNIVEHSERCDRCQEKNYKEQERCYFDSLADRADIIRKRSPPIYYEGEG